MKFTEEDLNVFTTILDEAESFRPLVKKVIDTIESYGPELSGLFDDLIDYSIKRNTKTFNMYIKAGFSREEAMLFILNSKVALVDALNNHNKKK